MNHQVREQFDELLEGVLASLPGDVRGLLDEIPLIVEDEPSDDVLTDMGIDPNDRPSDLCGLHWGVPINQRSVTEPRVMVDQILVFRGPIRRLAGRSKRRLEEQIRITLLHEIGHHFGLDEKRLDELGYG